MLYPDSVHVRDIGLHRADDESVWRYAAEHACQRSFLLGPPPKVIWIRRGNCSTDEILGLLSTHHAEILAFNEDSEATFLALG